MNYMIFDLEFNQVFNFGKEKLRKPNPKCPFEIIHIGAAKLDNDLNPVAYFDKLVKPVLYTKIHPYVKKITGITRQELKTAESFKDVYRELSEFIRDVDVLCVWGNSISLSGAAEAIGIPIELKFHNAFNDALYTAEVFK